MLMESIWLRGQIIYQTVLFAYERIIYLMFFDPFPVY